MMTKSSNKPMAMPLVLLSSTSRALFVMAAVLCITSTGPAIGFGDMGRGARMLLAR